MILLDPAHAADFKAHLNGFEARVPHLYLDGPGNVTIGVGCLIPSASACEALNWPGGATSLALAAAEWQKVKDGTPGLEAASYAHLTTLRLPDAEMDRLRDQRIDEMENDLIREITGVAKLPQPVIQALCDMSFNLGITKLRAQFFAPTSHFGPAIFRGDWKTAAAESERKKIQQGRNDYTRDLIMSACA